MLIICRIIGIFCNINVISIQNTNIIIAKNIFTYGKLYWYIVLMFTTKIICRIKHPVVNLLILTIKLDVFSFILLKQSFRKKTNIHKLHISIRGLS